MSLKNNLSAFGRSFNFAAKGIARCLQERNFRFHAVAAVYVLIMARHFLQTAGEWCALILTVALVLCAEAVNTAVEHAVDLACPEHNPRAGAAKDVAAGAVLLCALAAVAVACVLFLRWDAWRALFVLWGKQWWRPALLATTLAASLYVVFRK